MPDRPEPRPDSLCARPPDPRLGRTSTPPLAPPLVLTSVFQVDGLDHIDAIYEGRSDGHFYARDGHPNRAMLETKAAALEGSETALACSSGMAAEAALLLSVLQAGDHVALSEGLYGRTVTLVGQELARFGVRSSTFDGNRPDTLKEQLGPSTRLVFAETISNPLTRLADLDALARVAHDHGALLAVDNTFAPLICRPLDHGADVVTHSATKLIGGHSDVTLGLLCGRRELVDRAAQVASSFGMTSNPFESWLCLRGLTTLGVRSARAYANALELARRLEAHPRVRAAHYPGLTTHADHDLATCLLRGGFGAIVTIDLGDRAGADRFIKGLKHVPFAPSLGDVSTTLSHPAATSHRTQTPEQWARQGITPGMVRLSIGIEDVEDLWEDMSESL
jgi:cystathionine beta-lyase/cystathionine gamma-synthase